MSSVFRKLLKCQSVSDCLQFIFSDAAKIGLTGASIGLKAITSSTGVPGFTKNTNGISVRFPALFVPKVQKWLGWQVDFDTPKDVSGAEVTRIRARLHDGTNELYWNGNAWVNATDVNLHWNTLKEIHDNLENWDAAKTIAAVFELQTSDETLSPVVRSVKWLYEISLDSFYDAWLYETLIAGLKEVNPVQNIAVIPGAVTTIDWTALIAQDEFGFKPPGGTWATADLVCVSNESTDPVGRTNILKSFDGTIITLTVTPAATDVIIIRFRYQPTVADETHSDYIEVGSSPAILFEVVNLADLGEATVGEEFIDVWTSPPSATVFPASRRQTMEITLGLTAPLLKTLHTLAASVVEWLQQRRTIRSLVNGDTATLRIVDAFSPSGRANEIDIRTGTISFLLENLYFSNGQALETPLVAPGVNDSPNYTYGISGVTIGGTAGGPSGVAPGAVNFSISAGSDIKARRSSVTDKFLLGKSGQVADENLLYRLLRPDPALSSSARVGIPVLRDFLASNVNPRNTVARATDLACVHDGTLAPASQRLHGLDNVSDTAYPFGVLLSSTSDSVVSITVLVKIASTPIGTRGIIESDNQGVSIKAVGTTLRVEIRDTVPTVVAFLELPATMDVGTYVITVVASNIDNFFSVRIYDVEAGGSLKGSTSSTPGALPSMGDGNTYVGRTKASGGPLVGIVDRLAIYEGKRLSISQQDAVGDQTDWTAGGEITRDYRGVVTGLSFPSQPFDLVVESPAGNGVYLGTQNLIVYSQRGSSIASTVPAPAEEIPKYQTHTVSIMLKLDTVAAFNVFNGNESNDDVRSRLDFTGTQLDFRLGVNTVSATWAPVAGTWYRITVTWGDALGNANIYIDDALIAGPTLAAAPLPNTGDRAWSWCAGLVGAYADARLWTVELTAANVSTLHSANGLDSFSALSSLVTRLAFSDFTGPSLGEAELKSSAIPWSGSMTLQNGPAGLLVQRKP